MTSFSLIARFVTHRSTWDSARLHIRFWVVTQWLYSQLQKPSTWAAPAVLGVWFPTPSFARNSTKRHEQSLVFAMRLACAPLVLLGTAARRGLTRWSNISCRIASIYGLFEWWRLMLFDLLKLGLFLLLGFSLAASDSARLLDAGYVMCLAQQRIWRGLMRALAVSVRCNA